MEFQKLKGLTSQPYDLLGVSSLIILLISIFTKNEAIDYTVGDTYVVIKNLNLYRELGIVLLIFWGVYIISRKILLSNKLSQLHVGATLLPLLTLTLILKQSGQELKPAARSYYVLTDFRQHDHMGLVISVLILIGVILIGQVLFLINLLAGLIRLVSRPNAINQS